MSWDNRRSSLFTNSWQGAHFQTKDEFKVLEGETIKQGVGGEARIQGGGDGDVTSEALGMCSASEQELTLMMGNDVHPSVSTSLGGNTGTDEGGIVSLVSSADTKVREALYYVCKVLCGSMMIDF